MPAPGRQRPGRLLTAARLALLVGAAWTALAAWMQPDLLSAMARWLAILLALLAIAGAALLRRFPLGGILLLLLCLGMLAGSGVYFTLGLFPGVVLAASWAVGASAHARTTLGYLLLGPGVAAGFFGIFAVLSFYGQQPLSLLPAPLNPPLHLADALLPLWLLPLAFLGAWLLVTRKSH